jgi:hypothetical protein
MSPVGVATMPRSMIRPCNGSVAIARLSLWLKLRASSIGRPHSVPTPPESWETVSGTA